LQFCGKVKECEWIEKWKRGGGREVEKREYIKETGKEKKHREEEGNCT
jgi:hypothetical protein